MARFRRMADPNELSAPAADFIVTIRIVTLNCVLQISNLIVRISEGIAEGLFINLQILKDRMAKTLAAAIATWPPEMPLVSNDMT